MHPMDSSLDDAVHVNGQRNGPQRSTSGESIPGRRRTSLDNSCLLTSESVMLEILRNNNCAASIDDHHYDDNNMMNTIAGISKQSRRSSLDNEHSIPITFLANSKNSNIALKVDLDHDSHMNTSNGSRRLSPNQLKKNSVTSRCDELPPVLNKSLPLMATNENVIESEATETGDINTNIISESSNNIINDDDDDEEEEEDLNDEDSFCDATGQEMGNKAYIVQELGASYYFNDEDYFNHHVKPHVVDNDDAASLDEIIEEEEFIETMLPPASSNKVLTNNEDTSTFIVKVNKVSDDDDDNSDDDSFCDAHGTDIADQKYLEKDLGASCYWECPTLAGAAAAAHSETTSGEKTVNNANFVGTIGEEDEDESER